MTDQQNDPTASRGQRPYDVYRESNLMPQQYVPENQYYLMNEPRYGAVSTPGYPVYTYSQQQLHQTLIPIQNHLQMLLPSVDPATPNYAIPLQQMACRPYGIASQSAHHPHYDVTLGQEPNSPPVVPRTETFNPEPYLDVRPSRSTSFISNSSSLRRYEPRPSEGSSRTRSRSASPDGYELTNCGIRDEQDGTWACAYPGCTSRSRFRRGCDLRKHYKRHTKSLFCRHKGCPQATERGFSSRKDRDRHEAKHDPQIVCEVAGCSRVFSRPDNMRDHVRRMHVQA